MIPVTIPKTNPQNIAPISQYLRDVPNRTFAISRSCRWLSSTLPAAMLGGNRIRLGLEGLAIRANASSGYPSRINSCRCLTNSGCCCWAGA